MTIIEGQTRNAVEQAAYLAELEPSPLFRLEQGAGAFSLEHIAAMLPARVQRPVGGGSLVGPNGQAGAPVMVEGPGIVVFLAGGGQLPYPLPQDTDPQDVISAWETAKCAWVDR